MSSGIDWAALDAHLQAVAADLRIHPDVLRNLAESDHWSFTIQASALIEAMLTETIVRTLGDPRLEEPVAHLNLQGRSGKIAFCRALDLFEKDDLAFIEALTALRGHVAHDIRKTGFDFTAYVASLPTGEQAPFLARLIPASRNERERREILERTPTFAIWLRLVAVLGSARSRWLKADLQRGILEHYQSLAAEFARLARESSAGGSEPLW